MSSLGNRRSSLERQIALRRELARRKAKEKQTGVGGLFEFVKYFWHVLEPKTKFVDGWAIRAICEHLEAVTEGRINRLLINVPPGFSKPVHVEEPVLTDRGYKRLGDVRVGDMVVTHKGRLRRVVAVHEQGNLPLLKLTTWAGREVKAAGDHPFLTPDGWVELQNLKPGNYVGVPRLEDYPDHGTMTPEEARLLGYLVGDGCISQRSLAFVNMDQDAIDDFIYCAASCGFYAYQIKHPNERVKASKVVLKSTEGRWSDKANEPPVLEWLRRHNLYLSNSYTKRIPQAVMASGPTAISNFVGAYWSCDGSITVRHANRKTSMLATASTVSIGLAHDLLKALGILNIEARVRRHTHELETKSQPGGEYVSYIVQSSTRNEVAKIAKLPGLMKRKRDIADVAFFDRFEPSVYTDEVMSVVPDGSGECRCLTVDEDSSFVVNGIAVHNSMLTNCFWPAWEWGPMNLPHLRTLSFSYAAHLTERDNGKFRDLIKSADFQALYGDRFVLTADGVEKPANNKTGWKLSSSIGGVSTGERGDRLVADDLHNVADGESDVIRTKTVRLFDEAMSNRLNDLQKSAIVVIMQRVHENDVAGHIITHEPDYSHLLIPMEWDGRRYTTSIGWTDPREYDGELAWPERYPEHTLTRFRRNAFLWAGQYQQTPEPRGGGLFKRDWWHYEPVPIGKSPPACEYIVASLDSAYTKQERNDPSGFTVWGVYRDKHGNPKMLMLTAWRKHLEIHGPEVVRKPNEPERLYLDRAKKAWGLCEWVAYDCKRLRVDRLLIEAKASGHSVAQEMQRLYANEGWGVELIDPEGDKYARAVAVVHLWSDGIVAVPASYEEPDDETSGLVPRDWAQVVIDEMATFPNGRFRDLTDSTTQAMRHLRAVGLAVRREERDFERVARSTHRAKLPPLYPT